MTRADIRSIVGIALVLGGTLGPCAASESLATCTSGLAPISTVAPELPSLVHNEFTGVAKVAIIVRRDGSVKSPAIISAQWRPIGRSRGQPDGYDQAILTAVSRWRYPVRRIACRHEVRVEIGIADVVDVTASGVGSSARPTDSASWHFPTDPHHG